MFILPVIWRQYLQDFGNRRACSQATTLIRSYLMAHENCKMKFRGVIWSHEFSMNKGALVFMTHEFLFNWTAVYGPWKYLFLVVYLHGP